MIIVTRFAAWLFHSYEEFCELNLTYFKIFGLFQMVNPYDRVSKCSSTGWLWVHACITAFTGVHTVLQFVGLFAGDLDYKRVATLFTHVGNWTIAALKFANFAYSRRRLNYLFDVFRLDFLSRVGDERERREILFGRAYVCNWFILLYVTSCLFTCAVWNVYPMAELIYHTLRVDEGEGRRSDSNYTATTPKSVLDSWYPFDSQRVPIFYFVYAYEFVIYAYMLFAFCCYDSYLFSMFTMMTAQFEVLSRSFSDIGHDTPIKGYDPHLDNLFLFRPLETLKLVREDRFRSINSESALDNLALFTTEKLVEVQHMDRVAYEKGAEETRKAQDFLDSLLECTFGLQKANRYANELIEVYNSVIVYQVLVSIITICLMAFQTVIYFSNTEDEFTGTFQISKCLLYFACAFLLLLLSCKCSGDLNDARRGINAAFYDAHWHEFKLPKRVMRILLFSMTCSQKSHVVEITHRFPVDLHIFSEIVEICFTYFTFLLNYYRKRGH